MDRIDLQVDVPRPKEWPGNATPISSEQMRDQVYAAQTIQLKRYSRLPFSWNSELFGSFLRKHAMLDKDSAELLQATIDTLGLSMRAYDRILKLARTIAERTPPQAQGQASSRSEKKLQTYRQDIKPQQMQNKNLPPDEMRQARAAVFDQAVSM